MQTTQMNTSIIPIDLRGDRLYPYEAELRGIVAMAGIPEFDRERRLARLRILQSQGVQYDLEDEEKLLKYTWRLGKSGYVEAYSPWEGEPSNVLMHRVVCNVLADPAIVDHRSGDRADNRKVNLHVGTYSDNMRNRAMPAKDNGLPTGIHRLPYGTFTVRVTVGTFATLEEAIAARNKFYRDNNYLNGEGQHFDEAVM